MLVKMQSTSDEELNKLCKQFEALDRDGTGLIEAQKLTSMVIKNKDAGLTQEQTDDIIKQVD